jgi:5-(carboxyamino)imidazole ribonucleotide synthase
MNDSKHLAPILPGATLGVIGGGQLGRYFVLEARRMGYDTWVLDPDPQAPAAQLAGQVLSAAYDDVAALEQLGEACDAVTIEFENVPATSLEILARLTSVAPPADSVRLAQDRHLEKQAAHRHGLNTVPYAVIESAADIDPALEKVELPAILKTSRLGYDGKGQMQCATAADVATAFAAVNSVPCVLEQRIALQAEISVVLARGHQGDCACFPVAENVHVNGILATSTVPSLLPEALLLEARQQASTFADGLNYLGVLAIEFFIDEAQNLLFNEMAPRPHNSGHYTLDATASSQFEQQLRAMCALPLASTALLSPVTMLNLLGDSWQAGAPPWLDILDEPGANLHLYGKSDARAGRKMGHINCLAASADASLQTAAKLRQALNNRVAS